MTVIVRYPDWPLFFTWFCYTNAFKLLDFDYGLFLLFGVNHYWLWPEGDANRDLLLARNAKGNVLVARSLLDTVSRSIKRHLVEWL
jgi:hypothetical protein